MRRAWRAVVVVLTVVGLGACAYSEPKPDPGAADTNVPPSRFVTATNTALVLQTIDLAQNDDFGVQTWASYNTYTPTQIAALIDIDTPAANPAGGLSEDPEWPAPGARNGTLSQSETGGPITYTPSAGFAGTDTFSYWACPTGSRFITECAAASVTVTVRRPTTTTTTTTRPPSTTTTVVVYEPSPATTTTAPTTTTTAPTTTTTAPTTTTTTTEYCPTCT